MTTTSNQLLRWSARILGILVSLFIGAFALDAFREQRPLPQAFPDFISHLVPAVVLLAVVAASFRWEWIGAVAFIGLATLYALISGGRLDWVLAISGPLLTVGGLFLWSWVRRVSHPSLAR
jgi:Na+/H+-dicarboxylate symporter